MSDGRRVDRDLVEELLNDESLSFREIARQADCSDWTVRSIARDVAGDDRPMKHHAPRVGDEAPASVAVWPIVASVVAVFAGVIWLVLRRPPLDGGPMT
jgi:hypothetical protein